MIQYHLYNNNDSVYVSNVLEGYIVYKMFHIEAVLLKIDNVHFARLPMCNSIWKQ